MKDPLNPLQQFYELCESANPSRMLPDPAVEARRRIRSVLGKLAMAFGPLMVGGAFGLLLLMLGATYEQKNSSPSTNPIFNRQVREAGLKIEEFPANVRFEKERTERPSWRA